MKKMILAVAATISLVSCSNSNNKITKKKPELNRLQKTMCFVRLRTEWCNDWAEKQG